MKNLRVADILLSEAEVESLVVQGWVRTKRESKEFVFLEINDGSCLKNLQAIVDAGAVGFEHMDRIGTGAAVSLTGTLVESPGQGQKWELKARELKVLGEADATYPLQKKRHTDEYLRTIAHLRPRTNKFGALNRIRAELSYGVHQFFREQGFFNVHAPIITGSDCEGAGEMFQVTTLDLSNVPKKNGKADFDQDFFGKEASLTVSGQLAAENLACALGRVYTFGPTFRAENSNTPKHAAEFWMIEPEMAFAGLSDNMDLGESCIKWLITHLMDHCRDDLELFGNFVDKGLFATLDNILAKPFIRLPYAEAVTILKSASRTFEFPVDFGTDLQTEHERYLTEDHFKQPVIVFDYPKEIKAFYMRLNDDDKTVGAMDVLVPRIGELIGGSAREERLDVLERRIEELGLPKEDYWWYLDLRRFGSVPHAGFGMGFERLLMLVTGIANIRDVIPFPRTPRHLEF
ncbi:asparagine--tRNA ligase [Desulfomicrobium baculatum]|uniref:Asparagine--tRNA ligase n=1 Tax=Desulfomicrobium baculatum (strain DSM 4028 / VKM B-1378 / X) TaxID=525897 RepID=C7LUV3_DESBD|nr:asparagine--tRNA ligase [Desulfomicrobium baculatum]ACU88387.1 asparaginyl-tRNA synthetase [Desulfomicrobium baculatum DSM 4028]